MISPSTDLMDDYSVHWGRNVADTIRVMTRSQRVAAVVMVGALTFSTLTDLLLLGAVMPLIAGLSSGGGSTSSQLFDGILDLVWPIGDMNTLEGLLVALVLLFTMKAVLQTAVRVLVYRIRLKLAFEFSNDLVRRLLHSPLLWHKAQAQSRLVRDVSEAQLLVTHQFVPVGTIVSESVLVVATVALFLVVAPGMTAVLSVTGLVSAALFHRALRGRSRRLGNVRLMEDEVRVRKLTDMFRGIRDIRAIGLEERVLADLSPHMNGSMRAFQRIVLTDETLPVFMEVVAINSILLAVLLSQRFGVESDTVLPVLAFLVVGVIRLIPGFARVTGSIQMLHFGSTRSRSLLDVLTSDRFEPGSIMGETLYFRVEGSSNPVPMLCLRSVSFSFETSRGELLKNVSLDLSFGQTVGLVGASGSGKSTLIELLAGLYPPDQGEIVVRSRENFVRPSPKIALVSQEPFLFSASIRDNVQIGERTRSLSEDEVRKCLKVVEMNDFVESLPDGVDTRVGAGGVSISGGQAQRLMIARALMLRPSVLLLDEAASAIDEAQEARIIQRIRRELPDSLVILVTHRTSSLRLCDRVISLTNGTVSEVHPTEVSRLRLNGESSSTTSDGSL